MNLPRFVGYLVFFLLPVLLWLLVTAAVKRKGFKTRVFALIAGSDNRLSLSRLQAFGWTLVIFGSFAAAMAIHTTIRAGSPADIADYLEFWIGQKSKGVSSFLNHHFASFLGLINADRN